MWKPAVDWLCESDTVSILLTHWNCEAWSYRFVQKSYRSNQMKQCCTQWPVIFSVTNLEMLLSPFITRCLKLACGGFFLWELVVLMWQHWRIRCLFMFQRFWLRERSGGIVYSLQTLLLMCVMTHLARLSLWQHVFISVRIDPGFSGVSQEERF